MASRTIDEILACIRSCAGEHGVETYVVGGFVRDSLLGKPGKDIDLLTVGDDGMGILKCIAQRFSWAPPQQFERFGTGQIRGDDFIIEIVRARSEQYDPHSRKPSVTPGSLDDDIWRRDFTVNSLCQTLDGDIIDRTALGIADLHAGVLRTPLNPNETFSEDPLRMFRAARFRAQLGFTFADGLLDAMRSQASRISIVSSERIAQELQRLLTSPHPRWGMEALRDGGILAVTLPELVDMVGVEQGGFHTFDVFDHTMHALDAAPPDLITRLAVLFHDVGKPPTHAMSDDGRHTFYGHADAGAAIAQTVLERLRFSNDDVAAVAQLVRLHLRPIQYQPHTHSDSAVRRIIRDAGPLRNQMLDLARADTRASSYPNCDNIDHLQTRMETLDQGGEVSALVSPLSGEAIMAAAGGRPPGPWVGRVKKALEEAILDGQLASGDASAAQEWLAAHPELLN